MMEAVGRIDAGGEEPLLKMWKVSVQAGERLFRQHRHGAFEIMLADHGGGTYTTESAAYAIRAEDLFVFAGNEIHCITDVWPGGMNIVNLHFEPRYLWNNPVGGLSDESIALFFSKGHAFPNRLPRDNPAVVRIRQLVREMLAEFARAENERDLMVQTRLNEILVLLVRHFRERDSARLRTMTANPAHLAAVRRALGYMEPRVTTPLTLAEIAAHVGMSPAYFSTLFRQIYGTTLWQYLRFRRVERAMHLLREGGQMTVLDVAMRCGFNNTANFNKAFSEYAGMTPSQYRRVGGDTVV